MEKIIINIDGIEIRLDHLLKISGLASSGGQAGKIILDGLVKVNGKKVYEKRKKVSLSDEINLDDKYIIILKAN